MKFEKRQRFAIRKFSVGVASVLVGQFFVGSMVNAPQVSASEFKGSEGLEATKAVEEEPVKEAISEEITVPEPYRAPATLAAPSTEKEPVAETTTETTTTETTVEKSKEPVVETAPSTAPAAEEKPELKVDKKEVPAAEAKKTEAKEAEAKEAEAKPEVDEVLQPLKEQLNNSILEAKAVKEEAEKQEAKLDDSEAKKVLANALQASKAELAAAQQLSEKAQLTKADLELSIGRLQSAIESVYTEMKRSGHSGFVSYMLDGTAAAANGGLVGPKSLYLAGTDKTERVEYKVDSSVYSITADEYEFDGIRGLSLTDDAKALGFSISANKNYDTNTYTISLVANLQGTNPAMVAGKTYNIGFYKDSEPSKVYSSDLTIKDVNDKPYMTIENYSGFTNIRKNGALTNIKYKMGLTRITSDEVELTEDAKKLGLTYDKVGEYVTGDVLDRKSVV